MDWSILWNSLRLWKAKNVHFFVSEAKICSKDSWFDSTWLKLLFHTKFLICLSRGASISKMAVLFRKQKVKKTFARKGTYSERKPFFILQGSSLIFFDVDCLHMSAFELHLLKLCCDFYLFKIIEAIQQPVVTIIHFKPMFYACTPWKHQNTFGFLMFSEGIEMEHRLEMG